MILSLQWNDTAPLLYWYNIVHASVVFLYSSLKFINLYCRCYVFLWQTSLQNFLKFFNLFFLLGVKFALPNSDRNKLICYGCCYSDMQLYMILFLKKEKQKKHQC